MTRQVFLILSWSILQSPRHFFVLSQSVYNLQNLVKLIPECKNHGYDSSVICYLWHYDEKLSHLYKFSVGCYCDMTYTHTHIWVYCLISLIMGHCPFLVGCPRYIWFYDYEMLLPNDRNHDWVTTGRCGKDQFIATWIQIILVALVCTNRAYMRSTMSPLWGCTWYQVWPHRPTSSSVSGDCDVGRAFS